MKVSRNSIFALLSCARTSFNRVSAHDTGGRNESFLSMIGDVQLQYHPSFFSDLQNIAEATKEAQGSSRRLGKKKDETKKKSKKSKKSKKCDPVDVELLDYPQWQEEKGYWIGEYTFLKADGDPYVSPSWNYPYDHYTGFITGEVSGNSYRQRNVFLYPPQDPTMCEVENPVVGDGECGTNGNTKVFEADQSATTCSSNEELGGDIEGLYVQGPFALPTKTELVGKDNALLYQVFVPGAMLGKEEDVLLQSQLTTITKSPQGQVYRTRTAQSFDAFVSVGLSTSASYYRERKVSEEEFYAALESTVADYNINEDDLCVWDSNNNAIPGVIGSLEACREHLEESFSLHSPENIFT